MPVTKIRGYRVVWFMWELNTNVVNGGYCYKITYNSTPLTFIDVANYWVNNEDFRSFYIDALSRNNYVAYRWETPPISDKLIQNTFEYVLLDSPGLERNQNDSSFREHLNIINGDVITFSNLGKDATLIVPRKLDQDTNYCHLAGFIRTANQQQSHELWVQVGKAVLNNIGSEKKWLSTAGAGVPWLHVRIDSRPKYYHFQKYRNVI